MGAQSAFYSITAKTIKEVKSRANGLRETARYDHGHNGYTGTIAEDNGDTKIIHPAMPDLEAEKYIEDHAEKWEATLAIKILNTPDRWLLGGIYSC